MARVTVAALLERIEALEARIAELEKVPPVQLVREIVPPPSLVPPPLDMAGLWSDTVSLHASYCDETAAWPTYL